MVKIFKFQYRFVKTTEKKIQEKSENVQLLFVGVAYWKF